MPILCIAAAQSISVPGNLAANIARHCAFVEKAASAGVQLLLFPELSLSGYEPDLVAGCVVEPAGEKLAPWQPALIYYPHPDTKQVHHQPASVLELLAPPLGAVSPGDRFELSLDGRRCRLIQPARLRARLLEFLKFRVLAAQAEFFGSGPGDGVEALRPWLQQHWPEACDLSDADLQLTLEQARFLYTEA